MGPMKMAGRPAKTMVSVYWVTECVCSSTQTPSANPVRPEPISETSWPNHMVPNVLKSVFSIGAISFPSSLRGGASAAGAVIVHEPAQHVSATLRQRLDSFDLVQVCVVFPLDQHLVLVDVDAD